MVSVRRMSLKNSYSSLNRSLSIEWKRNGQTKSYKVEISRPTDGEPKM
jgi:hypothetical protein